MRKMIRRVDNPPNPYESAYHEWLEEPPRADVEVYEEVAKSILSENDSPDLPFRWSVNPYRGCRHGCIYCYARPYHEYLGFGAGTDFETKLVVKVNAPELLANALAKPRWQGESIHFSGITDCYQPLEAVWSLTRRCLEVCLAHRNPAVVVTKSYLIIRDADLLAELNRAAGAAVYISITFADDGLARLIEPNTPPPSRRFEALRRLRQAGVPVGVLVAPIIPGLNDRDIPEILRRAADAGAEQAGYIALRLPGPVRQVFLSRIKKVMPDRAKRIENRIRDIRGGGLDESAFGRRMRGEGVYWESIRRLFEMSLNLYGLRKVSPPRSATRPAHRPSGDKQLTLGFKGLSI